MSRPSIMRTGSEPAFNYSHSLLVSHPEEAGSRSSTFTHSFPASILISHAKEAGSTASFKTCPATPFASMSRISFAPLPTTEPRKRHRTVHLGVAGRSQLIRNGRQNHQHYRYADEPEYDEPQSSRESLDAENEALIALGRLVRDAGKSLWVKILRQKARDKANGKEEVDEKSQSSGLPEEDHREENDEEVVKVPILVVDDHELAIWEEGQIPPLQDPEADSEEDDEFDPVATRRG